MVFETDLDQMIRWQNRKSRYLSFKFLSILTKSERRNYLGIITSYVVVAGLDAMSIYAVYMMVDRFQLNQGSNASVKVLATGLVVLLVLRAGVGVAATFLNARWSEGLLKRLLNDVFKLNLSQTYESMTKKNKGELIRDINQVRFVIDGFTEPVLSLSRELFTASAILLTLLILDPVFATVTAIITGYFGISLTRKLSLLSRSFGERRNVDSATLNNITSEVYDGGREIRAHTWQNMYLDRFSEAAGSYALASSRFLFALSAPRFLFEVLAVGSTAIAAGVSIWIRSDAANIAALLAAVGVAAVRLAPSAAVVSASLQSVTFHSPQVASALDELYLLRTAPDSKHLNESSPFIGEHGERSGGDVTISIDGLQVERGGVLIPSKPMSASIEGPGLFCLVGESGKGKSTVLNVLMGFESRTRGQITVNHSKSPSLLSSVVSVSFVGQEPFIPSGSLTKILSLEGHNLSSIDKVLEGFNLNRRISPDDDLMHEEISLSGGERYRLALVTAVCRDSTLMIFDEPTAFLDQQNVALVVRKLKELSNDHLVICSTHDETLINEADQVLRIE